MCRIKTLLMTLVCSVISVNAADYLVTSQNYEYGWWIQYQQKEFKAGVTTFSTLADALAIANAGEIYIWLRALILKILQLRWIIYQLLDTMVGVITAQVLVMPLKSR